MSAPPDVAVVVSIFTVTDDDLRVLLIRRSADPFRDEWALPGGLLGPQEPLDRAAARKLLDETGVSDVYLEQLYTFGELSTGGGDFTAEARRTQRGKKGEFTAEARRTQRGKEGGDGPSTTRRGRSQPSTTYNLQPTTSPRAIAVTYFALVQHPQVRLRDSGTWQPAWHSVFGLPPLAFDNNTVVDYAVRRLRAKLEYTNVAYSLLPRNFTLSELQQVYEAILDREMDKRNFRRRMLSLGVIRPGGGTRKEGAHRPAQLYTFTKREPMTV